MLQAVTRCPMLVFSRETASDTLSALSSLRPIPTVTPPQI